MTDERHDHGRARDERDDAYDEDAKGWLAFATDRSHALLGPRKEPKPDVVDDPDRDVGLFGGAEDPEAFAKIPKDYWAIVKQAQVDRIKATRRAARPAPHDDGDLGEAGVPGANNWVPIGPSVVRKGQA